jgi:hypothetical protein
MMTQKEIERKLIEVELDATRATGKGQEELAIVVMTLRWILGKPIIKEPTIHNIDLTIR